LIHCRLTKKLIQSDLVVLATETISERKLESYRKMENDSFIFPAIC